MANMKNGKFEIPIDAFDFNCVDSEMRDTYEYFDSKFKSLLESYAPLFGIENYSFYIKDDDNFNAFAKKTDSENIIGITNGYAIILKDKFNPKYFENIIFIGILNKPEISDAMIELYEDKTFDFTEFLLECSIKFTFHHEFQHLLQRNSIKKTEFYFEEIPNAKKFSMRSHALEFDADRMAAFEVLKFAFAYSRKLENKSNNQLKCLIYMACSSMVLTIYLLHFGLSSQPNEPYKITENPFYLKERTHPHPFVRIENILEFYYDNATNDFKNLDIDAQELLKNVLGIVNQYFNQLNIQEYSIENIFTSHTDEINEYLQEIYDFAIKMPEILNVLKSRNISF